MRSLWPAWATAQNPVFRYETGRWRRSRWWRYLWPAVWGLGLVIFAAFVCAPTACVGLLGLTPPSNQTSAPVSPGASILLAGLVFVFASSVVLGLANWLLGLVSSALAATLIARDREVQAWPLMRLTNLRPVEIVGGKLAALLATLQSSLLLMVILRLLTFLAGGLALIGLVLVDQDVLRLLAELRAAPPFDNPLMWVTLGLVGLFSMGYWLIEPYFTAFYNGAVGLAVSTFARTRQWAIALVFITQFTLGLALYWPIQQTAAFLPLMVMSFIGLAMPQANVDPTLWALPSMGLPAVVLLILQVAVLASCLALAIYRVERLSD